MQLSNLALVPNQQITMSSLEMIKFINETRAEGAAKLRHDHFMDKVPQVLGETDAPKFRGIYLDSVNRKQPCYYFPKREACLMAMAYSYELQAKVFDRMTQLETAAALPESRTYSLQPEARLQIAQIVQEIMRQQQEEILPELIKSTIASQGVMLRHGKRASEIWKSYGLEVKGLRGYAVWFGNRLEDLGCSLPSADDGDRELRLFCPDKADIAMNRQGLIDRCNGYIARRKSKQLNLDLGRYAL